MEANIDDNIGDGIVSSQNMGTKMGEMASKRLTFILFPVVGGLGSALFMNRTNHGINESSMQIIYNLLIHNMKDGDSIIML